MIILCIYFSTWTFAECLTSNFQVLLASASVYKTMTDTFYTYP